MVKRKVKWTDKLKVNVRVAIMKIMRMKKVKMSIIMRRIIIIQENMKVTIEANTIGEREEEEEEMMEKRKNRQYILMRGIVNRYVPQDKMKG